MIQGKQNINKTRQKQSLVNDGQHQLIHSWKIDIDAVIWTFILKASVNILFEDLLQNKKYRSSHLNIVRGQSLVYIICDNRKVL